MCGRSAKAGDSVIDLDMLELDMLEKYKHWRLAVALVEEIQDNVWHMKGPYWSSAEDTYASSASNAKRRLAVAKACEAKARVVFLDALDYEADVLEGK